MATTLVISPTTKTMLKITLYNGYLNSSFLVQFTEVTSADVVVGKVVLYILRDKEWRDEGCLLCNGYIMKGLTMNSP